jgi:hypothetical protein
MNSVKMESNAAMWPTETKSRNGRKGESAKESRHRRGCAELFAPPRRTRIFQHNQILCAQWNIYEKLAPHSPGLAASALHWPLTKRRTLMQKLCKRR